jgi:hypothetical protein
MKKMFLLFSHQLTPLQVEDAKKTLEVDLFVPLPQDLQRVWSNIPAELESLEEYLQAIKGFLLQHATQDDVVLVQGDFCAVYDIIKYAQSLELIPVCSTTKRKVEEAIHQNKIIKTSTFEHVRYRRY